MIDNYKELDNGVITQINKTPFVYDTNYVHNYISNRQITDDISYLRYGYINGIIGRKPTSILDVGYGDGNFLQICSKTIKQCYGTDISGYPVPDKVDYLYFSEVLNTHIDVITFFDSLEHYEDINFVKDLNCNTVVISVPNCHYFSDEWFTNWKHRKPNEHLWHFNDESLVNFMSEMGYNTLDISNIEDIIRTPYDSRYSNILTGVFGKRV